MQTMAVAELPVPRLQNIVATFSMNQNGGINLSQLAMLAPFIEFNAKRFAAGVVRLTNPKTTCLVFASGKGVCTGAKTEDEARIAAIKYVSLLRRTGMTLSFRDFKIQNIVSAVYCPFRLDLVGIAQSVPGWVSYEPDLFPGLMYRKKIPESPDNPKAHTLVFICFQSGRCVITGGRHRNQILQAWRQFYNTVLVRFAAEVDYGSSGNYRVSQHKQEKRDADDWLLQQIAHSVTPEEGSSMLENHSDLVQLQMAQNPEILAVRDVLRHVGDTQRFEQPTQGLFTVGKLVEGE